MYTENIPNVAVVVRCGCQDRCLGAGLNLAKKNNS